MSRARLAAVTLLLATGAAACGTSGASSSGTTGAGSGGSSGGTASTLRLGYFANVTHASALVGVAKGYFAQELGSTKLTTQVFNDGPTETTALLSGAIDAAFVGPSPAINSYVKGDGAVRLVSGATLGGAELVVAPSITSPAQLTGKTIADPQLGNTQDVALRTWLNANGHHVTLSGGDVKIAPTTNATALQEFTLHRIDGAWEPEPWASRLVLDGGGHVLVDEKSLWPGGKFATTVLVVRTDYLKAHPQTVKALIKGELEANAFITSQPQQAQQVVNAQIKSLTGKALSAAVIARAFSEIQVSDDPAAGTLQTEADHAFAAGTLKKKADLKGLVDLTLLDQLLAASGGTAPSNGGLSG